MALASGLKPSTFRKRQTHKVQGLSPKTQVMRPVPGLSRQHTAAGKEDFIMLSANRMGDPRDAAFKMVTHAGVGFTVIELPQPAMIL